MLHVYCVSNFTVLHQVQQWRWITGPQNASGWKGPPWVTWSCLHCTAPDLSNYVVRLSVIYLIWSSWLKLMMKWGDALKLQGEGQNCYFQAVFLWWASASAAPQSQDGVCCSWRAAKDFFSHSGLICPALPCLLSGCAQRAACLLGVAQLSAHRCALPHRHFLNYFRNVLTLEIGACCCRSRGVPQATSRD